MKTIYLIILSFSLSAVAQDFRKLSEALYEKPQERDFVESFFAILKNHKEGHDPLMRGKGPGVVGFQIDKMKFAFMKPKSNHKVDLVIFNWDSELFNGLELDSGLTLLYGKDVFILKDLDEKSIASQGENGSELTNFSYVLGANYLNVGGATEAFLDWKPNPDYLPRTHPLRKTLNFESLVILSPDDNLLWKQAGDQAQAYKEMVESTTGFKKQILGTMIHEMYHVKSGIDVAKSLIEGRVISENRKLLVTQLEDAKLVKLLSAYTGLVFKLGSSLSETKYDGQLLQDLGLVINHLKKEYPNAWNYLWNYEYTEGFAEYSSVGSLVDAQVLTLEEAVNNQITDQNNNIAYRTGALGGLYLRHKLKTIPYHNEEDHRKSVWELILELENIKTRGDINSVINMNQLPENEVKNEIDKIKDYLISTILDV